MSTTTATPTRPTRAEDVRPGDVILRGGGRFTVTSRPRRIGTLVLFDIDGGHLGEWLDRPATLLDVEPHEPGPYELVIDFYVYATGTLPDMLRMARGCGNARIYRTGEGTPIIQRAGSDSAVEYVRRLTRGGIAQVQRRTRRQPIAA